MSIESRLVGEIVFHTGVLENETASHSNTGRRWVPLVV